MKIRDLKKDDAVYMLEWMHDEQVVKNMQNDFQSKTLDDCVEFIEQSLHSKNNVHEAIADDSDVYMGTVSLKNVDFQNGCAEFAITIRSCAMGQGYSSFGMKKALEKGFCELNLKQIYWYVDKRNARAINFYKKMNYRMIKKSDLRKRIDLPEEILSRDNFEWYIVEKEEFMNEMNYNAAQM